MAADDKIKRRQISNVFKTVERRRGYQIAPLLSKVNRETNIALIYKKCNNITIMRYSLDMYRGVELKHLLILNDELPDEYGTPGVGCESSLERFRNSSWGVHQAQQPPRYAENFPYDESNNYQQMVRDLGDAVHPVEHNVSAHRNLQSFWLEDIYGSRPHGVDPLGIIGTRFAMAWHDTGESTHDDLKVLCDGVVGDIPSGQKTDSNRATERRILGKNFQTFLPDVPDDLKSYAIAINIA